MFILIFFLSLLIDLKIIKNSNFKFILKMKKLFFLMLFFLMAFSYSQDYNLPPGTVLTGDVKIIDYSFKLENIEKHTNIAYKTDYLHEFSPAELLEMKNQSPQSYNYYTSAVKYFESLSETVKKLYTIDELWHIYKFDQALKEKLSTY
jgi:hypothetical protein